MHFLLYFKHKNNSQNKNKNKTKRNELNLKLYFIWREMQPPFGQNILSILLKNNRSLMGWSEHVNLSLGLWNFLIFVLRKIMVFEFAKYPTILGKIFAKCSCLHKYE